MVKKKNKKNSCFCCDHIKPNLVFIGLLFFAVGLMVWASEVGIIQQRFFWPTTFMVLGIMFVFKSMFGKA